MKTIIFALLVGFFTVPGASAAEGTPLAAKSYGTGFVPAGHARSMECELFADHLLIRKTAGTLAVTKTIAISLKGDIQAEMVQASQGKITELPAPTDGPVTFYTAYPAGPEHPVTLKAEGSQNIRNDSQAAATLVGLLDSLCE